MTDVATTDATAAAAAAAATAAAAAATATQPWHTGLDPILIGHAQNKGWKIDTLEPRAAFEMAARAHLEAQKLIGSPPEKTLRIPEASAPPAEIDAYWQRLGAPKEAKDLDLSTIKTAAGQPLDEKFSEVIRTAAVAGRVPKDAALALTGAVQKHLDGLTAETEAIKAGNIATEKAALKASWGANYDANMFVANQAFTKLAVAAGMTSEKAKAAWDAISVLGNVGAAPAMEMMRVMGERMGEGRFVQIGGTGTGNMPMTREAAQAEIATLKKDTAFGKALTAGGAVENQRWTALHKIAFGQQNAA